VVLFWYIDIMTDMYVDIVIIMKKNGINDNIKITIIINYLLLLHWRKYCYDYDDDTLKWRRYGVEVFVIDIWQL